MSGEIVTVVVGAVISALTMYFEYQRKNRDQEYSLKLEELKNSSESMNADELKLFKVLLRHDLCEMYNQFVDQGFVTEEEMENMTETFEAYQKIGGNHNGEVMYHKICDLYNGGRDEV